MVQLSHRQLSPRGRPTKPNGVSPAEGFVASPVPGVEQSDLEDLITFNSCEIACFTFDLCTRI
jgi:hypothetical protein